MYKIYVKKKRCTFLKEDIELKIKCHRTLVVPVCNNALLLTRYRFYSNRYGDLPCKEMFILHLHLKSDLSISLLGCSTILIVTMNG